MKDRRNVCRNFGIPLKQSHVGAVAVKQGFAKAKKISRIFKEAEKVQLY